MKLHLRAAWKALRGYAAAQENRASSWSPSGGSANGEVGMAAASVAGCQCWVWGMVISMNFVDSRTTGTLCKEQF